MDASSAADGSSGEALAGEVLPGQALPGEVRIAWGDAATATIDALVALLGHGATAGHLCPRCGGDDHGRPWARLGDERFAASASRAAGRLLVAVRPARRGALGVDLEAEDAPPPEAALVLHPDDDATPLEAWVAKEAVLKARGTGLRTAPSSIRLADWRLEAPDAPEGLLARACLGPA